MNKDNQYLIITDDKFACVEVSDEKSCAIKIFFKKIIQFCPFKSILVFVSNFTD